MKSKYKERAFELLRDNQFNNTLTFEELKIAFEQGIVTFDDVIYVMCQLAEEFENSKYPKDTYSVITWADSQELFEQEWFDECILINDDVGLEMFGSSAYLVPIDRYNEFYNL